MIGLFSMSTDSVQFVIIAGLISALGGVIIYIQSTSERHQQEHNARTEAKLSSLEAKIDQANEENSVDHARVVEGLTRVEEVVKGMNKVVDRHEGEINRLQRDVDYIRGREL
jgi:uncharacterized protein YpmB